MGLTAVDKHTGKEIPREKLSPKHREDLDRRNAKATMDRESGFPKVRARGKDGGKDE